MIDDMTNKGTAIIDLDTVKPGLVHTDIADCLRSCCNPAGEETDDISSMMFDMDLEDGQNLMRARVQVQLCRSIEANEPKIRRMLATL